MKSFEQVSESYICREFSQSFSGGIPDNLRGHDWYILQAFTHEVIDAMEELSNYDVCLDECLEDDYVVVAIGIKRNIVYTQPQLL